MARCGLAPSWPSPSWCYIKNVIVLYTHSQKIIMKKDNTCSISPVRGSYIRIFLSFDVVTIREPFQHHDTWKIRSGKEMADNISPVPTFQMIILQSAPADNSTLLADGCQARNPTRRWWPTRSTTGSVNVRDRPWSGICQTLTVVSSDELAIILSLNGHHAISNTGPLWPATNGWLISTRPGYKYEKKY